ncbi:MAG TPA: gamma-glutamylcyclotransferase family protein, partial [Mycobacteriales bacterium]|nr:gamma-glutamylcyclotransferase family protein [Mycobacteriales bacterium]
MALYAAYGSNMDTAQMKFRCPHSPAVGTGWLEGWRVTFGGEDIGWEGALATIVEEPGSTVFVMLYDVLPEDEERLDQWDGADMGLYS